MIMKTFHFTIILFENALTEKEVNKIAEAGCTDATVRASCGEVYVDFDRKALSFGRAI